MLVLCSDSGGEGWKPHCEGGAAAAEGITHRESSYKTELQEDVANNSSLKNLLLSGSLIENPATKLNYKRLPKYFQLNSNAQNILSFFPLISNPEEVAKLF